MHTATGVTLPAIVPPSVETRRYEVGDEGPATHSPTPPHQTGLTPAVKHSENSAGIDTVPTAAIRTADSIATGDGSMHDTLEISAEARAASDSLLQSRLLDHKAIWTNAVRIGQYLDLGVTPDPSVLFDRLDIYLETKRTSLQGSIDAILSENGITLAEDETLHLEVEQEGHIVVKSLTDNVDDTNEDPQQQQQRIAAISEALNSDEELGHELLRLRSRRVIKDALLSDIVSADTGFAPQASLDLFRELDAESVALGLTTLDSATRRFLVEDHFQLDLATLVHSVNDGTEALGDSSRHDGLSAALLGELAGVRAEFPQDVAGADEDRFVAEFSLQNGTLVDTKSVNLDRVNQKLFQLQEQGLLQYGVDNDQVDLMGALTKYNIYVQDHDADRIGPFSLVVGSGDGVEVAGEFNRPSIPRIIKSWFSESFEQLAQSVAKDLQNLLAAEHGDIASQELKVVLDVDPITGIRPW